MKEKIIYILLILNIFLSIKLFYKTEYLENSIDSLESEQQYTYKEINDINKNSLELKKRLDSMYYAVDEIVDRLKELY